MEKKDIKVSIILPIHNAGDKLNKCLETLKEQTLKELEIICILDCPTDGSDAIVREYASKDDRFVIIENEKNLHIGESRNKGLSIARGEYIGFSDHDDYRELNMYEMLYTEAKSHDCDICMSNQCADKNGKLQIFPFCDSPKSEDIFKALITNKPMSEGNKSLGNIRSVWNHIFRRSFIEKYGIKFPDTKKVSHEDTLFLTRFFARRPTLFYMDKNLYYWRLYEESTINNITYGNIENNVRYIEEVKILLDEIGRSDELFYCLVQCTIRKLYSAIIFQKRHAKNDIKLYLQEIAKTHPIFNNILEKTDNNKRLLLHLPPTKILMYFYYLHGINK